MFRRLTILFWLLFSLLFFPQVLQANSGQNMADNWLGATLCIAFPPFGFKDPYSGPLGLGAFYERRHVIGGLCLGGQVAYYGFYPLRGDFSSSFMVTGGIKAGWEFPFPVERRFSFSASPYLSCRYYWRRFDFQGQIFAAVRPMLAAGADLDLLIRRSSLLGVNLELVFILDNSLRFTMGQGQRVGVRF
jgi:hypothetical protein